jgi:hypothetical protein
LVEPDEPRTRLEDLLSGLLVVCSICHASGVHVVGLEVLAGVYCTAQPNLVNIHLDHSCVAKEHDDPESHAAAERMDMIEDALLDQGSVAVVKWRTSK